MPKQDVIRKISFRLLKSPLKQDKPPPHGDDGVIEQNASNSYGSERNDRLVETSFSKPILKKCKTFQNSTNTENVPAKNLKRSVTFTNEVNFKEREHPNLREDPLENIPYLTDDDSDAELTGDTAADDCMSPTAKFKREESPTPNEDHEVFGENCDCYPDQHLPISDPDVKKPSSDSWRKRRFNAITHSHLVQTHVSDANETRIFKSNNSIELSTENCDYGNDAEHIFNDEFNCIHLKQKLAAETGISEVFYLPVSNCSSPENPIAITPLFEAIHSPLIEIVVLASPAIKRKTESRVEAMKTFQKPENSSGVDGEEMARMAEAMDVDCGDNLVFRYSLQYDNILISWSTFKNLRICMYLTITTKTFIKILKIIHGYLF